MSITIDDSIQNVVIALGDGDVGLADFSHPEGHGIAFIQLGCSYLREQIVPEDEIPDHTEQVFLLLKDKKALSQLIRRLKRLEECFEEGPES